MKNDKTAKFGQTGVNFHQINKNRGLEREQVKMKTNRIQTDIFSIPQK